MVLHDDARARPAIALPAVTVEGLARLVAPLVIDLRSPGEFAADHVPGALNVPLFDDDERALVGTLYRQVSPDQAFDEGRRIVLRRVQELLQRIAAAADWALPDADAAAHVLRLSRGGPARMARELELVRAETPETPGTIGARAVVVHCWRGGLRSRSVAALLRELGLERVVLLEGGYRAYRSGVLKTLAAYEAPPAFVLRGWTGVGKTLVLRELAQLRPGWVLDLEDAAQHRSSVLGMVGLEPVSQRAFESRLVAQLARTGRAALVMEGESRKVGDVIVPPRLWHALQGGTNLELVADVERRVEVLREDYLAHPASAAELVPQLEFIDKRLGLSGAEALARRFERGEIDTVVRVLLERYYDPLYRHSEQGQRYAARFDTRDPAAAARAIAEWIDARLAAAGRPA